MNLEIETPVAPDEWALNICKAIGTVDEYWNLPGGLSFFDKQKYEAVGISLKFQKLNLVQYNQKRMMFEPGLSIIDALMFNQKEMILQMIDNYNIL
jgi:hypothetical protein